MSRHDDERIDAALEALARPEPPTDHVARVLARTSGRAGSPSRPLPSWAMATAAAVLLALGVTWQTTQAPAGLPRLQTARSENGPYPGWGAPQEVALPVLPPQAYWGMDAVQEWESLRPGSGNRESRVGSRARTTGGASTPQWAWVPVPSGLPPIELEPITPAPIDIAPIAALEKITVEDITLAPIVIAPVDEQEKP